MKWHDPADDALEGWRAATVQIFGGGGASGCPSCSSASLRYFFYRDKAAPRPRGSLWVWCPACGSYQHSSVAVPEWWVDVEVPLGRLFHDPGWLEENWNDDWLERQPVTR
jgi:hypothetical protein